MAFEDSDGGCIEKCNIDELTLVLKLFNAQLSLAMHKSDSSVGELSNGFTLMMDNMRSIKKYNMALDDGNIEENQKLINTCCITAETHIHGSVVSFQFYDRLSQQLEHLITSLSNVAVLLNDGDQPRLNSEWKKLQETIRSSYTTGEEEQMYTAVMAGKSIEDAIRDIEVIEDDDEDEIDLF